MTQINRSAIVCFTPEQMFALVNDIPAYPEFVDHCLHGRIVTQQPEYLIAQLTLGKGSIQHSFTTHNRLYAPHRIELSLVEGPFKRLTGHWQFEALPGQGCEVSLHLAFEFSNRLIGLAFGAVMQRVTEKMVVAFCRRAQQVYPVLPEQTSP